MSEAPGHSCVWAPLTSGRDLRIEILGEPTYVDSNFVNGVERLGVRVL